MFRSIVARACSSRTLRPSLARALLPIACSTARLDGVTAAEFAVSGTAGRERQFYLAPLRPFCRAIDFIYRAVRAEVTKPRPQARAERSSIIFAASDRLETHGLRAVPRAPRGPYLRLLSSQHTGPRAFDERLT